MSNAEFGLLPADDPSPLSPMTPQEETAADYSATQMTTGPHLMEHLRERLAARGVLSAADLIRLPDGKRVTTAGAVIVRQRPGTAKGFVFLTLEDETGMSQAIVRPDLFRENRSVIVGCGTIIVEGRLQKQDGTLSVKGERFWPLQSFLRGGPFGLPTPSQETIPSHDFH